MKKNLMIVLVLVFAIAFAACAKQTVAPAPAPKTETVVMTKVVIDQEQLKKFLERWPVLSSMKQARALGLQEVALTEPCLGFNLLDKQSENPYRLQELKIGTKVWEDTNGIPRYVSGCLNPFFVPTKTELVPVTPAPIVAPPVVKKNGFWAWFWNTPWNIIKWILVAIVVVSLLLLLFVLCRWMARAVRWVLERFDRNTPPTLTPISAPNPAPVSTPTSDWNLHISRTNGRTSFRGEGLNYISIDPTSVTASRR